MISQCLSTTLQIIHDAYEYQQTVRQESQIRLVPDIRIVIEGDELQQKVQENDIRRAIVINDKIMKENIPTLRKQLTDTLNMKIEISCKEDSLIQLRSIN